MKRLAILVAAGLLLASGAAKADADDVKWIQQCQRDNKDEKASAEVIKKYCTCMNDKMSSNETRTITEWEKTHPRERQQCERQAGWK